MLYYHLFQANLVRKNVVLTQEYKANLVRKNVVLAKEYKANLVRKNLDVAEDALSNRLAQEVKPYVAPVNTVVTTSQVVLIDVHHCSCFFVQGSPCTPENQSVSYKVRLVLLRNDAAFSYKVRLVRLTKYVVFSYQVRLVLLRIIRTILQCVVLHLTKR